MLRGGWTYGLADELAGEANVDNKSIGSTGLLNIIYQTASGGVDLGDYDAVLLDTQINDNAFFAKDIPQYRRLLDAVLDHAVRCGAQVVLLNFERSTYTEAKRPALDGIIEDAAERHGVGFFDVKRRLMAMAEERGQPLSELYRDVAHPQPEIAYIVGQELAGLVRGLEREDRDPPPPPFVFLGPDRLPDCRKERLKNSLIDLEAAIIDTGGTTMDVPPQWCGADLVGIVYDAAQTSGLLAVQSEGGLVKLLSRALDVDAGRKFLIWARPFHARITLGDALSLQTQATADTWERTEFSLAAPQDENDAPQCRLIGLLAWPGA